jgi:hypothetical protein
MLRHLLYEAASALMTRCRQRSKLRAWGVAIARHRGAKRARVAVARKLAVIMIACGSPGVCSRPEWRVGIGCRIAGTGVSFTPHDRNLGSPHGAPGEAGAIQRVQVPTG